MALSLIPADRSRLLAEPSCDLATRSRGRTGPNRHSVRGLRLSFASDLNAVVDGDLVVALAPARSAAGPEAP